MTPPAPKPPVRVIEELRVLHAEYLSAKRAANRSISDRDEYEDAVAYLNKKESRLIVAMHRHLPALIAIAEAAIDANEAMEEAWPGRACQNLLAIALAKLSALDATGGGHG